MYTEEQTDQIREKAAEKWNILPILHHKGFSDGTKKLRREYLGMEMSYGVILPNESTVLAVMEGDVLSEEEAFRFAMDNVQKETVYLTPMDFILENGITAVSLLGIEATGIPPVMEVTKDKLAENSFPLFLLSYGKPYLSASAICNEAAMERAAELIGDDLVILPSSCHEILLAPAGSVPTSAGAAAMIRDINEAQVLQEEQLLDRALFYNRQEKRLSVFRKE